MPENSSSIGRDVSSVSNDISLTDLLSAMNFAMEPNSGALPAAALQRCLAINDGNYGSLSPDRIDQVCEVFAQVIDAKSVYMSGHSIGVAQMAVDIAQKMKLPADRIRVLRRAALLHDVGKLRIPNEILDKIERLTGDDWIVLLDHARITQAILERIPGFEEVSKIAGEHHERLDGSGYPHALKAKHVSLESRVLILADCFVAMAEDRPYRVKMSVDKILEVLEKQVPDKLDAVCFEALQNVVERRTRKRPLRVKVPWKLSGHRPHWGWDHTEPTQAAGALG